MTRKNLSLLLPALLVLLWCASVNASRRVECDQRQGQTQVAARLKQGQFIRILTASGKKVSGHFVSFDGSRIVLEDRRDQSFINVDAGEIVEIKSGRGFWGSLRRNLTESMRILAKPVTDTIHAYQMMDAIGDLMG